MLREKVTALLDLQNVKSNNKQELRTQYIEQQEALIRELLQEGKTEEYIIKHYLDDISNSKGNEYTISYEEFLKLEKEESLVFGIKNMFNKELAEFKEFLEKLMEQLKEEKNHYAYFTNNDVLKAILMKQNDLLGKILGRQAKMLYEEKEVDKYLKMVKGLSYDKKQLRRSKSVAKIILKSPALPILTTNTFHRELPKFFIITQGLSNIPEHGPCIIAPHHHHAAIDPIIMKAVIDRDIYFMASTETFIISKRYGDFLHKIGTIPFTRDDDGRERITPKRLKKKVEEQNINNTESILKAIKHLQIGSIICIFPEDDAKVFFPTYKRPKGQEFIAPKEGAAYLSATLMRLHNIDAPIIPVGVKHSGISIYITAGTPIHITPDVKMMTTEQFNIYIKQHTEIMFKEIMRLSS